MTADRVVICSLAKSFKTEGDRGKVNVIFEKIGDKLYPINSAEHFCDTKEIFIARNYSDLEEKYRDSFFELKCMLSKFDVSDGDCRYVSFPENASEIKNKLSISEIISAPLPNTSKPELSLPQLPRTKTIYISHEGKLLGPFYFKKSSESDTECAIKVFASQVDLKLREGKVIFNHHYAILDKDKSNKNIFSTHIEGDSIELLTNQKDCLQGYEETVDYMSDIQVIEKYGKMIAKNSNIRNFSNATVILIKEKVIRTKEYRSNKDRFDRFFGMLDLPLEWGRIRDDLMAELIKSEKGENILNSYISDNRANFFKGEREEFFSKLKNEASSVEKEISNLKSTKEKIQSEIRQKKDELQNIDTEENQQSIRDELSEKDQENLNLVRTEINEYENKLDGIKLEFSEYSSLKDIQERKKNLEIINKDKEADINTLTKRRNEIASELKKDNTQLVQNLLKIKNEVDVLTGANPTEPKQQIDFNIKSNKEIINFDSDSRETFINDIYDKLLELGRKTDFDDLANIIITLSQSQFTLFSGLPGTGKTSLAKLIGQAMGIQTRLLNIPVARGWTSHRDILGFFNTLSQSFVPSPTGLYGLIEQMQDDENKGATSIVLLDEFNLSQPEHYFSPFLEMADKESNRKLYTGDPNNPELTIPNHLRFLGTINHDESVQTLTPRMLDRASIISFDSLAGLGVTDSNPSRKNTTPINDCISGSDFIKLFNSQKTDLSSDIGSIIDSITKVLHDDDPALGQQIIISYRKIKSISAYCNVASPLMISHSLASLDYAICQHIIPLLNGYGDQFGERLRKLLEVTPDELTESCKKIKGIISRGSHNMQTYGAFL